MKNSTEEILDSKDNVQYGARKCKMCDSRVTMSGGKHTCPKHGKVDRDLVYVDNAD